MEPLSCTLLVGSESPYGYPHLQAFLDDRRFDVRLVVLPEPALTGAFYHKLNGNQFRPAASFTRKLRSISSPGVVVQRLRDRFVPESSPTDNALKLCRSRQIPVTLCGDTNCPEFLRDLSSIKADYMFSAAWPQIFGLDFLADCARKLAANSHPSLLPKYRGAHPVFWAVRNGERETGLTFHVLTSQLDQGPVIAQIPVPIGSQDTRKNVSDNIAAAVPELTGQLASNLLCPGFIPQCQSGPTSYFQQDREIHHLIQWEREDASGIRNLVRACAGDAFCFAAETKLTVGRCEAHAVNRNLTNALCVVPGTIVDRDEVSFWVAASSGVVRVTQWHGAFDPAIGKVLR